MLRIILNSFWFLYPIPDSACPGTTDNSAPVYACNATKTTLKITSSHWPKSWLWLLRHHWCAKIQWFTELKCEGAGREEGWYFMLYTFCGFIWQTCQYKFSKYDSFGCPCQLLILWKRLSEKNHTRSSVK